MKMVLKSVIAGAALLAVAGTADAANLRPVRAQVVYAPAPAQNLIVDAVTGAVIGGVVGAVLCGPAAAACFFGTQALSVGGGIITGVAIGAGTGVVAGVLLRNVTYNN